jgi:hypothetical protein
VFTADSSSTTIEFLADSAYTSAYTGLDNVSVTASGSSTPEPASLLLFGSGLAGLGAARLRKRTKPEKLAATRPETVVIRTV